MPTSPHQYEDAVLKGTALVLLDLPIPLRGAVPPLRKLLDKYYPQNGITHILMNGLPVRSTSGEGVMECGAMFFKSAKATWALLDHVEVVLRTEDGPLELRRGFLQLGDQKILVEGVVTWGVEGRERPAPAPTLLAREAASSSGAEEPRRANSEEQAEEGGTVVVSMHFKEIYNRHRNLREDYKRTARGDMPSMFPLTPFMVYQMLLTECQPRKIVLIDSRRVTHQRVTKALVELEDAETAARVVHAFTYRAVEFVSEGDGRRNSERQGQPSREKAEQRPIRSEVRYYVNSYYSTRNGQSRFHANGKRNYHRVIVVRHQERDMMNITNPRDAALMSVKAPREWQYDIHANRLASVRDGGSLESEARNMEERQDSSSALQHLSASSAAAPNSNRSHPEQRDGERPDRRRRSSPSRYPARSGRRSCSRSCSSQSRSSSPSASRSSSRSSSASFMSSSSSSSSSSGGQHFRRRPRREDSRRRNDVRRSDTRNDRREQARRLERQERSPPHASAAAAAARSDLRVAAKPQTLQQQPESASHAAVVQAVPAPPLPPQMENDGLPPGWWPIFSEEYKQTYYAYRDPLTGAETTTWERPTA